MPTRAKRPCLTPRCRGFGEYRGRCKDCAPKHELERGTTTERGYGSDWAKLSRLKLRTDPVCQIQTHCQGDIATQVDHRIPFKGINDPLRLEWSNLQSSCASCNAAKGGRV